MTKEIETGVYLILNVMNFKLYFGHSINLRTRPSSHLYELRRGIHGNKPLQRDYDKYGESAFMIIIVAVTSNTREAQQIEDWLIKIFRTMSSRYGYTKGNNEVRSPESHVRDTERKFMRSRNYELLPGIDLDDPVLHTFIRSVIKGRDGIDIDDQKAAYLSLSAAPPYIIPIVGRVLLILIAEILL